jgi:hypothetical protein
MRAARRAGRALELGRAEREIIEGFDEAFRELQEVSSLAPVIRAPTALGFKFLNRLQPQVLGRLLGRPLTGARAGAVRAGLRAADDAAAALQRRIAAHWDAALPRGGTDAVARRVFRELKRANPSKPNEWVRQRLYSLWRNRAANRIYRDTALRQELREQAGIIVGRNAKTKSVSIHIRTKLPSGRSTQTPIDFDHSGIGHSDAVSRALREDDYRQLLSTVDPSNLQLMTGRENRNFIEALRQAERAMEGR